MNYRYPGTVPGGTQVPVYNKVPPVQVKVDISSVQVALIQVGMTGHRYPKSCVFSVSLLRSPVGLYFGILSYTKYICVSTIHGVPAIVFLRKKNLVLI